MVRIKQGSESDLMGAVANVGPVSVAIDGSSSAFRVSSTIEIYKPIHRINIVLR